MDTNGGTDMDTNVRVEPVTYMTMSIIMLVAGLMMAGVVAYLGFVIARPLILMLLVWPALAFAASIGYARRAKEAKG